MTTTMTSKGQVTVPKAIRDYLGLKPGSAVEFEIGPDGRARLQAARAVRRTARTRTSRLRGRLKTGQSTDELMQLLRGYDEDSRDPGFRRA
ncbi:MAG: AbrB/MazE/SpoVT family DNA-binding domain-containing protein [Rhodanobacteraceae bacterium]